MGSKHADNNPGHLDRRPDDRSATDVALKE